MVAADAAGAGFTAYFFVYSAGSGFVQIGAAPTSAAGAGTLRFEVVGPSLKLFFGPDAGHLTLLNYAYDTTLTGAGTIGMRTTTGVIFDNLAVNAVTLTSPGPVPFVDTFTQNNGAQLSRNWTERQGNFSIAGGTARGNDASPSIATMNGVAVADVAVQADMVLGANRSAGLIARYQANGSYYLGMVVADAAGANFTPYLFAYSTSSGFAQLAVGSTIAGAPRVLRVEVVGSSLKLFAGPDAAHLTLAVYAFDRTLTGAGSVGIRAVQGVTFDNYAVSAIPPIAAGFAAIHRSLHAK